jgi:hypothetical protein
MLGLGVILLIVLFAGSGKLVDGATYDPDGSFSLPCDEVFASGTTVNFWQKLFCS